MAIIVNIDGVNYVVPEEFMKTIGDQILHHF